MLTEREQPNCAWLPMHGSMLTAPQSAWGRAATVAERPIPAAWPPLSLCSTLFLLVARLSRFRSARPRYYDEILGHEPLPAYELCTRNTPLHQ